MQSLRRIGFCEEEAENLVSEYNRRESRSISRWHLSSGIIPILLGYSAVDTSWDVKNTLTKLTAAIVASALIISSESLKRRNKKVYEMLPVAGHP